MPTRPNSDPAVNADSYVQEPATGIWRPMCRRCSKCGEEGKYGWRARGEHEFTWFCKEHWLEFAAGRRTVA